MINITKPYKDDMIIPFFVQKTESEEINIDVYEPFYDIAAEFENRFLGEWFSDKALRYVDESLHPELEKSGYYRENPFNEWYAVYKLFSYGDMPQTPNIAVTDISRASYDIDETTFEADLIRESGQKASVIVVDGKIASICAENFFDDDCEKEIELAVETVPEFRKMGFAKAVLCDMSRRVLKMGKFPTYRTSRFNTASVSCAESAGFRLIGKEYYYNCYKGEE